MNRTRFTRGNGALTAAELNRQRDLSRTIENLGPQLGQAVRTTETQARRLDEFWAKITGFATWGTFLYRWRYSFQEMRWDPATNGFVAITGGVVGTENAYNTNEAFNANTSTILAPGYAVATIPSGFSYQPIKGSPVVRMYTHVSQTGQQIFLFHAENSIDGACP